MTNIDQIIKDTHVLLTHITEDTCIIHNEFMFKDLAGVSILPLSNIFRLDFRTILKVLCFFVFPFHFMSISGLLFQ
jgi:hypothetical protein